MFVHLCSCVSSFFDRHLWKTEINRDSCVDLIDTKERKQENILFKKKRKKLSLFLLKGRQQHHFEGHLETQKLLNSNFPYPLISLSLSLSLFLSLSLSLALSVSLCLIVSFSVSFPFVLSLLHWQKIILFLVKKCCFYLFCWELINVAKFNMACKK